MNADLKEAFSRIKPVCDVVMVCPSIESVAAFTVRVRKMKDEAVQELQQYTLFPFITHIKSKEIEQKYELLWKMVDAVKVVLEKVTVNSYEMCMKIETGLLALVFDSTKPGMVAEVPEELKLSVMQCLTALIFSIDKSFKEKLLKTQVPLLAQAVFVSVHIAKLERLRSLRLAAIHCLTAHTMAHARLTDNKGHITDPSLETLVVDMLASILPGVLAALQDVAMCEARPGHAVIVAALNATHRILCLAMHDKHAPKKDNISAADFVEIMKRATLKDKEVSYKEKNPKDIVKRSMEWYSMAGDKLVLITESLVPLRTHEHYKVRRELAVMCYRILSECNTTMQPSLPLALDVLISLSKDAYPEVAEYCTRGVTAYFADGGGGSGDSHSAIGGLCDNFVATLIGLPRALNNIDSSRKLSALNLLYGYLEILCDDARPQRLTTALSSHNSMQACCSALLHAAEVESITSLAEYTSRDVSSAPPSEAPWRRPRHLDGASDAALRHVCRRLGGAECADLLLDRLLDTFRLRRDCEVVCVVNWMGSAPNSSMSLVKRILDTYIEDDVWYSPLEVGSQEPPVTSRESLDLCVYNPRAWTKESVPDLYEGATETRYTDISYQTPRVVHKDPHSCATLAEAQRNLLLSCLLTEGVGVMALRLGADYQPYLLKTLCMVLERVGSKYEMLHLSGLKAINDIATACGHKSVAELIAFNADYFTNQVTSKLKKAWNTQSALQILTVVMEYSDATILNCLYGIVEDVLVQSCDKYHERDLYAYLQVFLTFVECIRKWFPSNVDPKFKQNVEGQVIDALRDVEKYVNYVMESEILLNNEELERQQAGKSVEEMYKEYVKQKEDNCLDYDDTVTKETPPTPQYITVTVAIIKRCVNFITSRQRDEAVLTLRILAVGLPILRTHENDLLPLVHQCWAPLVMRFQDDPVVVRRGLELLVTMAELAKDFIQNRAVKEILPKMYKYLIKSASDSRLKDAGSAYRNSQAYTLQVAALSSFPSLAVDLGLDEDRLDEAMTSVDAYLSNKQPKPLQALAVKFFQAMLVYDHGAVWHHLRTLCNNDVELEPPTVELYELEPIRGTPCNPRNKDYEHNINLIFNPES